MKSIKKLLLLGVVAAGLSSCASLSSQAGMGAIYMDVQTGEHVTSNNMGTKVGTASVNNILGLVLTGDASIEVAAKSAGIKKISHVDSHKKNILGIFSTYKVIVYGD